MPSPSPLLLPSSFFFSSSPGFLHPAIPAAAADPGQQLLRLRHGRGRLVLGDADGEQGGQGVAGQTLLIVPFFSGMSVMRALSLFVLQKESDNLPQEFWGALSVQSGRPFSTLVDPIAILLIYNARSILEIGRDNLRDFAPAAFSYLSSPGFPASEHDFYPVRAGLLLSKRNTPTPFCIIFERFPGFRGLCSTSFQARLNRGPLGGQLGWSVTDRLPPTPEGKGGERLMDATEETPGSVQERGKDNGRPGPRAIQTARPGTPPTPRSRPALRPTGYAAPAHTFLKKIIRRFYSEGNFHFSKVIFPFCCIHKHFFC